MSARPTEAAFAGLHLDSFDRSACSPEAEGDFRGLCIAAPASIALDPTARFPLCGTYRVSAAFLNRFESMANEIVVVAVDARRHVPYATHLLPEGFEPAPSHIDERQKGFDRVVLTGWFNIDLYRWLPGLPRGAARYHVFATIAELVSNVVDVEIARP